VLTQLAQYELSRTLPFPETVTKPNVTSFGRPYLKRYYKACLLYLAFFLIYRSRRHTFFEHFFSLSNQATIAAQEDISGRLGALFSSLLRYVRFYMDLQGFRMRNTEKASVCAAVSRLYL
jgi:hypothetical protein